MGRKRMPEDKVKPFALYYRKYREAKKNGQQMRKRGRPKKGESSVYGDFMKEFQKNIQKDCLN